MVYLDEIEDLCHNAKNLGNVLDDLLSDKDIGQSVLADKVNYSVHYINRLANDILPQKMKLQDVDAIADALDCTLSERAELIFAFLCNRLKHIGFF